MFRPHLFLDVDASNGSGAPVPVDTPVPSTTPEPPAPPKEPAKDPSAGIRYQISRERADKERISKEFEDYKARQGQAPKKFDMDEDPDGTMEIKHLAAMEAQETFQKMMKESGIEDKFSALQYEKAQNEFFSVVEGEFENFKKLGIDAPSRQEMTQVLAMIADQGITPQQLIAIAKHDQIMDKMKLSGFSPGNGGKQSQERTLTQAEVNANIFKKFNM